MNRASRYTSLYAILDNLTQLNPISQTLGNDLRVTIALDINDEDEVEWEIKSKDGVLCIRNMPHDTCELSVCLTRCSEDERETIRQYGFINLDIQETLPGRMYLEELGMGTKVLKYGFVVSSKSLEDSRQCQVALRDFSDQLLYWDSIYKQIVEGPDEGELNLERLDEDFEEG